MTIFIIVFGLIGTIAAALAASRLARSAGRLPAASFGLAAFVIAALVYGGVLQGLVLYLHPASALTAAVGPEAVFLVYTGLAALAAFAAGGGLVWAWIAFVRGADRPAGRIRTTGLAFLFSLSITILAAPFLIYNQVTIERSIRANEAEIQAFSTSYRNGLKKLTELGALSRIEISDEGVTHYIGGPLYKVGEKGLAEYARAAQIYNTHVLGNAPMPVILRDSTTNAKIATFRTDGVFVVHTTAIPPQAAVSR